MEPRNRFQGMNSASLSGLAVRHDNPIPTWCLAPIVFLKLDTGEPKYIYRGRVEIGGVYCICPLSWSVHQNCVRDGSYSHQAGRIFPSWWNVCQKMAIATLCVLCACESKPVDAHVSESRCTRFLLSPKLITLLSRPNLINKNLRSQSRRHSPFNKIN